MDSVWKKLKTHHPEALQAAPKMTVEDARAQWTTYSNQNQWFDDVTSDLLVTRMVVDENELDENGVLLTEVRFKPNVKERIINMDKTHHDLSITGDRGWVSSNHLPRSNIVAWCTTRRQICAARHWCLCNNISGRSAAAFLHL